MLTIRIADQSLTDLAAKVETRWAIYPKNPNHAARGVGDLQDPSRGSHTVVATINSRSASRPIAVQELAS